MRFDAYAALAKLRGEGGGRAKRATCANQPAPFSTISTISRGQAVQAKDRKEAYEMLHPEVRADAFKGNQHTGGDGQVGHKQPSFADDQAAKTGQSARVIPWPGRGYPPEAIRQGVAEAFADYRATDDPQDPRAWA